MDKRFINSKTRHIEILVIILGTDSLEEVFGPQLTLNMLSPFRFQRLFQSRLRKPSVKKWRLPNIAILNTALGSERT